MKMEVIKWFLVGLIVVVLNLLLSAIGLRDLLTLSWLVSNLSNLVVGTIGLTLYGWVLLKAISFTDKVRL